MIFLTTVMMVSLMMAADPPCCYAAYIPDEPYAVATVLLILLPANIMTMVMYAFRAERKHISESETRFRNAMEYSAIGMALWAPRDNGCNPTKRSASFSVTVRKNCADSPFSS
ncbi:hypothetical protein OIU92_00640 [Escherichia coli]|nr:hypothetical protein [Escherichia coli]